MTRVHTLVAASTMAVRVLLVFTQSWPATPRLSCRGEGRGVGTLVAGRGFSLQLVDGAYLYVLLC